MDFLIYLNQIPLHQMLMTRITVPIEFTALVQIVYKLIGIN